jgi:hypothetical protein
MKTSPCFLSCPVLDILDRVIVDYQRIQQLPSHATQFPLGTLVRITLTNLETHLPKDSQSVAPRNTDSEPLVDSK